MNQLKSQLAESISSVLYSLSFPKKDFSLAPPKHEEFGDLSSNICLLLTKDLNKNPMEIGKIIADALLMNLPEHISDVTVTPPGFINFKIFETFYQSQVEIILNDTDACGRGNQGGGKTANVEFVSTRPCPSGSSIIG